MNDVKLEFEIQGDSEGFVTFECSFCESEFKLRADEFQSDTNEYHELFCPYCGLVDNKTSFYSQDVVEHVKALATNYYIELLNNTFGNMAKGFKNNKFISMEYSPLKKVSIKELKDRDTVEQAFECNKCINHFKVLYCNGISKVFCPYCGVDI